MTEEFVRLEIGFQGGQVMGAQVSSSEADELEERLAAGKDGTANLAVEDGRCVVVLSHVLYVKRFARESRVGFGT